MCTHHSRSTPYPLHGANEVRLLQGPGGWRGLSRAGWAGRAAASESPSAPSPSPPASFTALQPNPLRCGPRLHSGCSIPAGRLCLSAPQLPRCLAWGNVGGGFPTDCLCPLLRLEIWEVGCRERMWVNNLRPGEGSCHLCLPPAALELDAVYCGAPQLCRVSKSPFQSCQRCWASLLNNKILPQWSYASTLPLPSLQHSLYIVPWGLLS